MSEQTQRQNAIETLTTAAKWLPKAPALVGLFLVIALVGAVGQLHYAVSVVGSVVALVPIAVAHLTAAELVAERSPAVGDHLGPALRRLPWLVAVTVVTAIVAFVGLVFLIVPGLYILLRLGLAPVACVVDEQGVFESLATSWTVAEGNLLKLLGIQLAVGLVDVVIAIGVGLALASTGVAAPNDHRFLFYVFLAVAPVSAVLRPVTAMAIGRVYLENRDDTDPELTAQPGDDAWAESEAWSDEERTTAGDGPAQSDDDPAGSWPGENE